MEIISRSEAIRRGLSQYHTGEPCRNGHIAYRYTRSGTCSACIRENNGSIEIQQNRKLARARKAEMIAFKSRLFLEDLEFFRSIVLAAAQVREPSVQLPDVWKSGAGKNPASGTAVFTFSCFAEDLETLRATAQSLFDQRSMKNYTPPKPFEPPAEYWPEGDPR